MTKLDELLEKIGKGTPLETHHKKHSLQGQWAGSLECHIESDWLLVWNDTNSEQITFLRTGTHTDLFKA